MEQIILLFLIFLFICIPLLLTGVNIYNLFVKRKFISDFIDSTILFLGPLLTMLLLYKLDFKKWTEPLHIGCGDIELHEPFSREHIVALMFVWLISIAGYIILRINKSKLPPLVIVLCISSMYLGCILSILWILQLAPNIFSELPIFMACVFPLNYLIMCISLIQEFVKEYTVDHSNKKMKNKVIAFWYSITQKSINLPILAFIFAIPLIGLIIIALVLLGQEPDTMIKAFTETSDWLFSTKVSPEPILCEDHYLCTVAAGGHKKVEKPLRMGMRRGRLIIVNRQLCIANAFEDIIKERTPRIHKLIRHIYDKYGYPISKHIKTPITADITYIIMKPLEWLFLIVLYLTDVTPENRIAKQYLPKRIM